MEIKVTGISGPVSQSKGKASWQELTVTYVGKTGPTKKVIRSFEAQTFADFSGITEFPVMVDVTVKKEGDFWNWKGAKVTGNVSDTSATITQASTSTAATKGNWETSDERAAKQRYIVRQSSITNAISLVGAGNPIETILAIAKTFEDYVFTGEVPEAPAKNKGKRVKADVEGDPIN